MPFDRQAKFALIVAVTTLLACSVGFRYAVAALNIYLRKEKVDLRETFATISRSIGPWTAVGEDEKYDEAMLEELGTRNTITRTYALNGSPREALLNVHLAYYTGMIDAVPHVPDRCFVAGGLEPESLSAEFPLAVDQSAWREDPGPRNLATGEPYMVVESRDAFTNRVELVRMPVGDIALRLTEFARKDQPNLKYFGGYFFIANGRATATPEDIRLLAFKPSERYAYYCKVQFVYAAPGGTRERFLELVSNYLSAFLPELMARLPDWQQVEAQELRRNTTATPATTFAPNTALPAPNAALPATLAPSSAPHSAPRH